MSITTRGEHQIGIVRINMVAGTEGERAGIIGRKVGRLEFCLFAQLEDRQRFGIDPKEMDFPLLGMKVMEGNPRVILKNECRCVE